MNLKPESPPLKSGKSLEQWIHLFVTKAQDHVVKSDSSKGKYIQVSLIRSNPFELLINELKKVSVTGHLPHQHDGIKIFLNAIHLQGSFSDIEQRNSMGMKIDIIHNNTHIELKTRRNVFHSDIRAFLREYFADMVQLKNLKHLWWFVYFLKRTDTKAKKGQVCMYYLVLIEIDVLNYPDLETSLDELVKEVNALVETAEKQARKADEIEDPGILVPVENILVVDRLGEEIKAKDEAYQADLAKKNAELATQKAELATLKAEFAKKDALIAQLKNEAKS